MASIIYIPTVEFIGSQPETWKRVFLECRYARNTHTSKVYVLLCCYCRFYGPHEQHVYVLAACTLLGAWVGAFPVLLDWNRPWQVSVSNALDRTNFPPLMTVVGVAYSL